MAGSAGSAPVGAAEFAGLMAPLGPFGPGRQVVVGVSGGADSMALALLLQGWGDPLAVIVDHGLRADSAAEAALAADRLRSMGVPVRRIRLAGLGPGPDLGARARAARYQALLEACRDSGRPDLVVGHHCDDQAETVLMRAASGSGGAGLAGMAVVAWRGPARVLRPLLPVAGARLRATLVAAGLGWSEDPTNADPATARGGLRARAVAGPSADGMRLAGATRAQAEAELAHELARTVVLHPAGYAEVLGALSPSAWSALIWTVSGRPYPPPRKGVLRVRARGEGTLHGVRVGRGLAVRELAAMERPVSATPGVVWDGRFAVGAAPAGWTVGPLGAASRRLRARSALPCLVLETVPAFRDLSDLLVVPHVVYPDVEACLSVRLEFRPTRPLAGAPFVPF